MIRDQNGKIVTKSVRKESDGLWSATVWSGSSVALDVHRRYGYLSRRIASQADISETVEQTNRRLAK